jgi:hypothetical protein
MFQIVTAVVMVGVAFTLFYTIRRYMITQSERRMRTMLIKIGLDPAVASSGDWQTIMKEVRQRCRTCSSEDLCERWLAGEEAGENVFCPNSKVFESMRKSLGTII